MKPARGPQQFHAPRLPRVSVVLMILFQLLGSIALVVDWPPGPANVDWGVWVVIYGGYLFVVGSALFYAKTGQ